MCGIAGIYRYEGMAAGEERAAVRSMMDAIRHRGPDDEGMASFDRLVLGHKRLSIIDLEGGRQPMSNDDGSLCIVLNGEIYNYVELRDELASSGVIFRTNSDTEVLLRLYERYGVAAVEKLNGMFAFAIWDEKKECLVLCRDRLGIKPLYYVRDSGKIAFASEIKAFVKAGLVSPEINKRAFGEYAVLQMGLSDETLFNNVKKLMPGHMMIVEGCETRVNEYWRPDFSVSDNCSVDEAGYVKGLRDLLDDSVRMQIRSDVPVGSHLSGGMDSSAVCSLAAGHLGQNLDTFTGYFSEGGVYDESSYARVVNDVYGFNGHFCNIGHRDAADALEKIAYLMDEPQVGPGIIPQYFVSKCARENVKVVLSGLGGDEMFGGYARYYLIYLEECLKGAINGTLREQDDRYVVSFESMLPNLPMMKEYAPLMKSFWSEGLFDDSAKRYFRLMRRDLGANVFSRDVYSSNVVDDVEERFLSVFRSSGAQSLLNQVLAFDLKVFIPALLQVEDRTSMGASLESRVPLLDHRIVEYSAKMPPKIKWKGGRPKHILKEALKGSMPDKVWSRQDKRGFPTPIAEWFSGPLRGYVTEILGSRKARERGLYNYDALKLESTNPFDRGLWGALSIELWCRQFID